MGRRRRVNDELWTAGSEDCDRGGGGERAPHRLCVTNIGQVRCNLQTVNHSGTEDGVVAFDAEAEDSTEVILPQLALCDLMVRVAFEAGVRYPPGEAIELPPICGGNCLDSRDRAVLLQPASERERVRTMSLNAKGERLDCGGIGQC